MLKKKTIACCLILFCSTCYTAFGQHPGKNLQALLDSGQYFRFRSSFDRDSAKLPVHGQYYFGAYRAFLFNRSAQSNALIAKALAAPGGNDSLAAQLLQLAIENNMRLGEYGKAADNCRTLLSDYVAVLHPAEKEGIVNVQGLCESLRGVPPQILEQKGGMQLKGKRDIAGLLRFTVNSGKKKSRFIFDTGANLSTISLSEAKRMGVRILGSGVDVASSSRKAVGAQMGVADSLRVGTAVFRNVAFIVLPDKALRFLGGLYKIKGIIGLPMIAAWKEVQLTSEAELVIPEKTTTSALQNFGLHGFSPFTEMKVYNDSLTYLFDTGAASSVFGNRFYAKHAAEVNKNGKEKNVRVAGAGGVTHAKTMELEGLDYRVGGKSGRLKKASIVTNAGGSGLDNWHYGIVGQDILRENERVILNFESMFLLIR